MPNILVIDDEEAIRALIAASLEGAGHTIEQAASAEEALERLKRFVPDLIVSDIRMDRMSGYDLLQSVRSAPATATIPFIFITGVGDKQGFRQGMELGADDYITKPFSQAELLASVNTRLRFREVQRQQSEKRLEDLRHSISLALPHELRTPLTAILAFSKILEEDDELSPEERVKFAGIISSSGKRLHHLIENYLAYAQIELAAGDTAVANELQKARLEHAEVIVTTAFREKALDYQREPDIRFDVAPVSVRASHEHFAKMIYELADNAFKFSAPGTTVRVTGTVKGRNYEIVVEDRGRGMTTEHISAVDYFRQFDRTKHEQQGSGFGLAIVKRLVLLYGGAFRIESAEGQGTTVTIALPLAD